MKPKLKSHLIYGVGDPLNQGEEVKSVKVDEIKISNALN
jgi:hypothetical protein